MPTIPEQIARQSVVVMECSIPDEMTIAQWRALRRRGGRPRRVVAAPATDRPATATLHELPTSGVDWRVRRAA